jgi:hypothetical protein
MLQVFYAPGALCVKLRDRPVWVAALLLGGVFVAASFFFVPAEMWERTFREQMINSGRTLPAGFEMGGVTRVLGTVGGVFSWFVLAFFLAGVVTVVFHFLLGDEGRYLQYLSVIAHALLIPAIGALLVLPLKLAQSDPRLTLNLALFVPASGDAYWLRVLRMLDLLMIWAYVVMGVGISRVDARRGWGGAAAFLIVLAVCIAMVFATFTPGV